MPLELDEADASPLAFLEDAPLDPAYPAATPPDPVYPGQTRAPLAHPLDEIATPAIWSRLQLPLERALVTLWESLALRESAAPTQWVAIHYGRIALNAHGWERLRARASGESPDPSLVEPAQGIAGRVSDRLESLVAGLGRRRLKTRIETAERARIPLLRRMGEVEPADLDIGELARGPLDERSWMELLVPGLGARLTEAQDEVDAGVHAGLALEQRCTAELGMRFATRRTLPSPALVAYLTVPERIRAALDGASHWSELAAQRQERVERYAKLDVPREFFGRPRIEGELA